MVEYPASRRQFLSEYARLHAQASWLQANRLEFGWASQTSLASCLTWLQFGEITTESTLDTANAKERQFTQKPSVVFSR